MRRQILVPGFAIVLGLLGSLLHGQELVTDRPDFTESPIAVPTGTAQIEAGATWLDQADGEELSGPELLLRWGMSERLEFRLGLPDWIDPARGPSGRGDASVGAKLELGAVGAETDRGLGGWELALIGSVSLPTGDEGTSSGGIDPELILTLGRDLPRGWSVGTQLGLSQVSEAGERTDLLAATLVFGRGLGERGGFFAELAVEDAEDSDTAVLFHHG